MNALVSYGSFQTWPSSASGAGTITVSVPYLQHLGQEGMETAFWTPLGLLGPFWKKQMGQTTALAPGRAIGN